MDLEKLDNTIKELEEQSNNLKEFNKVYSEIGKLKQEIASNLKLLKENNESFGSISTEIKAGLVNSEKQLDKIENGIAKKIQELYNDSKAFQKELDSTIVTRLEKHKSDIQIDLRNEGTQIQRAFENTLNSNFNAMESKLGVHFANQNKQLSLLKILAFVSIGIGIGLAVGLYLK